ncbi:hypothetical protein AMK59_1859 [Oryctes borbonicus]|uniref:Phospholipase A2-like domain-containing protein n=1 Tax=Oryctes borbonicus TaxID=1629725 RepID=A0A0T6BEB3_9SCAR|nr:hypothetical protein AMK59_1859 [Oryctes borbonicus]
MLSVREGGGLMNDLINKLPVELHILGYQYCGPGTKLKTRFTRVDPGINQLDAACKDHDTAYSQHKDLKHRHEADKVLQEKAWSRVKASDASIGEKTAAWTVTNIMKAKRKMVMGMKSQAFRKAVFNKTKDALKHRKAIDFEDGAKVSLKTARATVKEAGGHKCIRTSRIISIPKTGGLLPLILIFGRLNALGGLAGGAAGIAQAANRAKSAQRLEEAQKHNKTMEAIGKKR